MFRTFKLKIIDILFLVLVVAANFITWNGITKQTIEGEGFYYFSPKTSLVSPEGQIADLVRGIDNLPKIASHIQGNLFGGNIELYMWVQFILIIILGISFYVFTRLLTGSPTIAFLATVYENLYYTGNYQFYARGHYQWFYQRVVETIPIFVSFFFITKFASTLKYKFYLISLAFYLFALFLTHYTTFFLPFYPIFLGIYGLFNIKDNKRKLLLFALSFPFVLITYFVTKNASLNLEVIHPNQTLIQSFLELKDVPSKIAFQLTVLTIPFPITKLLANYFKLEFQEFIYSAIVPTLLFYIISLGLFLKSKSAYKVVIISIFFSLLGAMFLTVYFNRVIVFNEIEQGRYYFVPGFYIGLIFSLLINGLVKSNNRKIILVLLLGAIWFSINTNLIWKKMKDSQIYFDRNRTVFAFLQENKSIFPDGSYVLVPTAPGSVDFINRFYKENNMNYTHLDGSWRSRVPEDIDANKLFAFDFDKNNQIIDKTSEYRDGLSKKKK